MHPRLILVLGDQLSPNISVIRFGHLTRQTLTGVITTHRTILGRSPRVKRPLTFQLVSL